LWVTQIWHAKQIDIFLARAPRPLFLEPADSAIYLMTSTELAAAPASAPAPAFSAEKLYELERIDDKKLLEAVHASIQTIPTDIQRASAHVRDLDAKCIGLIQSRKLCCAIYAQPLPLQLE
jgi:hypothetical protein